MAAIEQLGALIAQVRPDAATQAAVRRHIADTLGAWIAATTTAEGRALLAFRGAQAPLADRVAVNCALARLSEVDDIHLGAMITPGAIVIPVALTIAASQPQVAPDELAAAIVAGYEAMIRLGVAIDGPSVLYRGIWPTYFAAPFGVAAAASRLLGLDAAKTSHALATALIGAAPGVGHHAAATTARWLVVGQAAARGLAAAQAAAAGFTSDVSILEGDFLKNIFGIVPNHEALNETLDAPSLARVSFKPWCAARQTMAATQALKEIMAEGIAPDAIVSVEAAVLPPHLRMIGHGVTTGDRFSHLTSLPYQLAVAALAPDIAFQLSGPAGALPPGLAAFMARIAVMGDDRLLADGYPQAWPAQVTVTTATSRRERRVAHVPGDPARPFGDDDLRAKFRKVVAPVLPQDEADAMFDCGLAALDEPAAMMERVDALCGRWSSSPARR